MITKRTTFLAAFLMALVILSTACRQKQTKHTEITAGHDSLAVVTFKLEIGGWGYKINNGAKTKIYQDIIPSITGRHVFQTEEDARKIGELMMEKMRKTGTGLPFITRKDLIDLKIAGVE